MNIKLTVLVDNNTFIDRYFYDEPDVSYYITIHCLNKVLRGLKFKAFIVYTKGEVNWNLK